jgi:hypothetical protein
MKLTARNASDNKNMVVLPTFLGGERDVCNPGILRVLTLYSGYLIVL